MRFSLNTFLLIAFLTPASVTGQSTLGFRGGLSLASFGGENAVLDSRPALNFGGFFNVPVTDVIGVQVAVAFVQKGAEATTLGVRTEYALSYIEIPLLLTLAPPTSGNVGFTFSVGPALGFNRGCDITGTEVSTGTKLEFDCNDALFGLDVKSFEFGAMVGAGLDIGLTETISLVLDGFYNLGLTKIDNTGPGDDVKNRAFSILAGLSFTL